MIKEKTILMNSFSCVVFRFSIANKRSGKRLLLCNNIFYNYVEYVRNKNEMIVCHICVLTAQSYNTDLSEYENINGIPLVAATLEKNNRK